ncbi:calmodulin-like protein [Saccostrea cucullata]|uniref:calmodulin-like protein n=1 Tax=Saccostrea cuccullata TaxID=36930 RepID=UPI002ED562F9
MENKDGTGPRRRERRKESVIPFLKKPKKPREMSEEHFEELEEWWAKADVDGDGFISLEEYVKIMSANYVSIDMEKERMKAAFNLLDKNGDGRISLSEFQAVMMFNNNEMTKKKVEELFKEVDSGGKGYLDYTDFIDSHICSVVFQ